MKFTLIDRILELSPGERIVAVKGLSLAEEYLQDHFPRFPVMPGVLMLEAMFQASAWLVRKTEDFAHSVVLLKEAKNVKFQDFVLPGHLLRITATIIKDETDLITLKADGQVDGHPAVSGRLVLQRLNLADQTPDQAAVDQLLRSHYRRQFALLYPAA